MTLNDKNGYGHFVYFDMPNEIDISRNIDIKIDKNTDSRKNNKYPYTTVNIKEFNNIKPNIKPNIKTTIKKVNIPDQIHYTPFSVKIRNICAKLMLFCVVNVMLYGIWKFW